VDLTLAGPFFLLVLSILLNFEPFFQQSLLILFLKNYKNVDIDIKAPCSARLQWGNKSHASEYIREILLRGNQLTPVHCTLQFN
jgi:hypothetical protein